ncbi:RAB11-binding protein RELCH homolog isoform X2 [Neocloeon triangulifer]|uniref:RAB11-binding protein RELCH homolog isoform X2 n=1 Tax=Neocloeon triangulifer TaxID=2078957 RepID=UPI00286ECCC0|nr:RAB11-binding protein RELCH homolog isoform X2 [Neocloeon triangulifer]
MAAEQDHLSLDQIACRLLQDNFLLTALELHLELIEAGRELTSLKEFFSNPANFERQSAPPNASSIARSHSQATLDSLDISRLSEDGTDERVAVLEFELRKAKETIHGLRTSLTQISAEREEHVTSTETDLVNNDAARPHEQRALNFLVNEYLLRQGYKLTAVTFSEENSEQDFDDWDDVGLNIPRPPELHQLYRVTHKETAEMECQTSETMYSAEEFTRLKNLCNTLEQQLEEEKLKSNLQPDLENKIVNVDASTDTTDLIINETKTEILISPPVELLEEIAEDVSRELPPLFKRSLTRLLQISASSTPVESRSLMSLLVETLPLVTSAKKEDSIPLIVSAAQSSSSAEEISSLITMLFNLRKRPQELERMAVVEGVKRLAMTGDLLADHILPQTWELAGHKSVERRLLAAEICLAVAPLTPSHLRQAMLLPMLQQLLLEASEPEVRIGVVKAMTLVVAYTSHEDKYLQCEELCLLALEDQDSEVRLLAQQFLLPVLAQWALQIQRLDTHLVKRLLARLKSLAHDSRCGPMVSAVGQILPFILVHLASHKGVIEKMDSDSTIKVPELGRDLNDPNIFLGENDSPENLIKALCLRLNDDLYQNWPQMEWMLSVFLSNLFDVLCCVDVASEDAVLAFVKFYHQLSKSMGQHFTQNRIKPMFKESLRQLEDSLTNLDDNIESQGVTSLVLIPVLLVAILTTGDPNDTMELSSTLRHLLILLPSLKLSLTPLKVSVFHLCRAVALQDTVLSCLSEACKNSRPAVRLAAAQLTLHSLGCVHDGALTKFVLPQLAMLATDLNEEVKEVVVAAYAELASEQGVVQEESKLALQTFLKDALASHVMSVAITRALARILPSSDPAFAEDVVLPQLCQLAAFCLHGLTSQTRRMDLGQALVAALSVALQVPLSRQAIAATLVPALRDLSVVSEQCMQAHVDAVNNWLREAESRAQIEQTEPTTPKSDKPHLVQSAMSSATAAGRRSVEDVKQKMSSFLRKK